jgi:WG containing repeat
VQTGRKWGYIDQSGSFVIPPVFDSAMPFCAGVAQVATFTALDAEQHPRRQKFKGKHGFIDHSGKYVWRKGEAQVWNSEFVF